ncbi:hypothetical protein [Spirillospora albida]|uniref:hypothetical protein n=1 Tax=Spirillospora albida TaxID=58123 RepID=UPI0004C27A90|nr:hypothetical protein [Spirillospora albida]
MNDDGDLAAVRAAFDALDPVPAAVLAAGRRALAWRTPDAALAELSGDRPPSTAGLRGGRRSRVLTFTCADVAVELEVDAIGRMREITGRLVPGAAAEVSVRHPRLGLGAVRTGADPAGLFHLPSVPEGLVSLAFALPDGSSAVTSWLRL